MCKQHVTVVAAGCGGCCNYFSTVLSEESLDDLWDRKEEKTVLIHRSILRFGTFSTNCWLLVRHWMTTH